MPVGIDPTILEWLKKDIVPEGLEFKPLRENRVFIRVKPEDVDKLAERFVKKMGIRLIHASAVDLGQYGADVFYVYDFTQKKDKLLVILEAKLDKDNMVIPSVGKVTWQAAWPEREMKEFQGITFQGMADTRHQFLPFEWPDVPESAKMSPDQTITAAQAVPDATSKDWKPIGINPKNVMASLIPIGPYHPGVIEGQTVYIRVEGEHVVDADIKTGFHHRGIHRLIEKRGYNRGVYAAERVCGICSAAHGLAYVTCAENLYDAQVPERALYIRTLLVELNRIHSHILWTGVAADIIGWKTGFMLTWGLRESVMDIIEAITGNRVNYGIWRLGGVSRDVSPELAQKARTALAARKEDLLKLLPQVAANPVFKSRLIGIGPLDQPTAFETGAVGPVARASNWKIDVRVQNPPHAIYDQKLLSWDVVTNDGCDIYARVLVRVGELFQSIGIVDQCLEHLSKTTGEIREIPRTIEPGQEAVGLNEAPRGEQFYYMRAGGGELPSYMIPEGKTNVQGSNAPIAVRIRTPSYRLNAVLPYMLIGSALADVPIIMGSIDQCLACTDRVEIVNDKDESKRVMSWDELVRMSQKRWRS